MMQLTTSTFLTFTKLNVEPNCFLEYDVLIRFYRITFFYTKQYGAVYRETAN